ncbi:hypothetical protein L916_00241 [Phytophthora nicotianae]|uniref:Uncharacterized protein n=1 Tax=Phytophthora nicotianae TaxID=4792 RepID=W2JVT7_PHYNI|nr:hypothetical protein L916_00241 [Phytophthora nicotianae]
MSRRVPRRDVSLSYTFGGFTSSDVFLEIEMNYAFDCIFGMPWLALYQLEIDWLARSVKRRADFDVSEDFTHLLVAPRYWPHVTIVDKTSTLQSMHRGSRRDGRACVAPEGERDGRACVAPKNESSGRANVAPNAKNGGRARDAPAD